ncbi:MAG: YdcF family protein [Bacteroidota bacterium]
MLYLIKFIYTAFILPPGIFILAFILLSIKFYHKQRRVALCLIGTTVLLYLASISLTSDLLMRRLENNYRPPAQISGDVLVLLGGGATLDTPNLNAKGHLSPIAANRLLTCIQLYNELHLPIILSGGQVYQTTGCEGLIARQILLDLKVPEQKIFVEKNSLNTTENARYVKELLHEHHFRRPVLITSAFHLPRAVLQFEKAGIKVIPYPAAYHTNTTFRFSPRQLVPSSQALNDLSLALKEYLGLLAAKWY